MTTKLAIRPKVSRRTPKVPPHFPIKALRLALGLTLDDVCERVQQVTPELSLTRGALSAIESGTRGVSQPILVALCQAYGIPSELADTTYEPRERRARAS